MNSRRIKLLLSALTIGLVASACGGADEDPGKPADKEITIYSGRTEALVKPVLDKFQQQTGIKVHVRYGSSAQMAAQLTEEGDKSPADVFLAQDAGALGAVAKAGLFATLPSEVTAKVSPTYRSTDGAWVGVTGRSRVLAYNSDLVPATELPASVFAVTDPRWKGKVGIAPTNASFQAFVTALRVQHGDAKAKQFLADLKANDPQIRENNVQIVADIDAGKLEVGLVNHYYVFELAKERGVTAEQLKAKLHFFPGGDIGGLVNVSGIGVLQRSATDPDALALVNYLLGVDGQTYFAEQTFEYPLAAGVAPVAGLPALDTLVAPDINLNELDTLAATVAMLKEAGLA